MEDGVEVVGEQSADGTGITLAMVTKELLQLSWNGAKAKFAMRDDEGRGGASEVIREDEQIAMTAG
jgi:hypothetical protein